MTVKQRTINCIFTHKFKLSVYHSDSYFLNIESVFNLSWASCLWMLFMQNREGKRDRKREIVCRKEGTKREIA